MARRLVGFVSAALVSGRASVLGHCAKAPAPTVLYRFCATAPSEAVKPEKQLEDTVMSNDDFSQAKTAEEVSVLVGENTKIEKEERKDDSIDGDDTDTSAKETSKPSRRTRLMMKPLVERNANTPN